MARYPSRPCRPWKIGIWSPGRTCTMAFFHERERPAVRPRRFGLDLTDAVRTSTTRTSNRSSMTWLGCMSGVLAVVGRGGRPLALGARRQRLQRLLGDQEPARADEVGHADA